MHALTLKKSNCKNCYKCLRTCPVKSIRFSGDQAHIIEDSCILCGHCFVACPQEAKQIEPSKEHVKVLLQGDAPVIVSLAPSFIANYPGCGIKSMRKALKELGFADVEETAIGATMVKREYENLLAEKSHKTILTSCCHSINLLIQRHYPDALSMLAPVLSPMVTHCKDIKMRNSEAKTVFIGPCVAKKDEAKRFPGMVDAVLTFEELSEWLAEERITIEKQMDETDESRARIFPTTGGVLKSMDLDLSEYKYIAVDGTEDCMHTIEAALEGKVPNCFIELSSCNGSCINGPVMERYGKSNVLENFVFVSDYAGTKDFDVEQPSREGISMIYDMEVPNQRIPSESDIKSILAQMGKKNPEDELNCSSCGYATCRDKAVAIYQGKASIEMCLPYLREKAEKFSDIVTSNMPTGLIILNNRLEIQQINPAASRIFDLKRAKDLYGEPLITLMSPKPFYTAKDTNRQVTQEMYLAEYDKTVETTVLFDKETSLFFGLLRDVTQTARERTNKEEIVKKTTEVTDKIVEKQMRIVQEIAMLLGETTAETQVALNTLKQSIDRIEHDEQFNS